MEKNFWNGLLYISLLFLTTNFYAQNVCLDFDGVDDEVATTVPIGSSDFTVEMWYYSTDNSINTDPLINFRRLFSFSGSPNTSLQVGLNGGVITVEWTDSFGNILPVTNIPSTQNNGWNHLALTRSGQNITIYLDCQSIWTGTLVANWNMQGFILGPLSGVTTTEKYWLGRIDDVRIWDIVKTPTQICDEKDCVLSCNEANLQLNWNLDEGIAGANNTSILNVPDCSPNNLNGIFNGFALTGSTSNYFDASGNGLVYPNLNNTAIEIRDYPYQTALLTDICPGEPAHFTMLQNGVVPGPFNNVDVAWWYYDDLITNPNIQLLSPPFTDFQFGVPSGNINYDCSSSIKGFVDRTFYAISTVESNANTSICEYKSEEYDLRICCDIGPATVDITPPDPICDNTAITVNVCLNSSDIFVQVPGPHIDIIWTINGGSATSLNGQLCFSHIIFPPYPSLPHNYIFKATVTNCNNKSASFENFIRVDPEPVCGTIDALPLGSPQNLTFVSNTPHPTYEICPDNDAIIGIDQTFQFCNPQWQYSFTNTAGSWIDLGFSNSVQNTNILPTSAWTGASIFYRIQCNPLITPSGCDPCFSNVVEIRLQTAPVPNTVSGTNQLCKGGSNTLTVTTPNPAHTYTWFCDGLQVAIGPSFTYTANQSACYWFETSDGCYTVDSPQYCVEVCEVIPVMSCPQAPNECACLGLPITLDACASYSTCNNPAPSLQFTWFIDNVQQPASGCTITHTPPVAGATYRVEIVNTATGCAASLEQTVLPCDKN